MFAPRAAFLATVSASAIAFATPVAAQAQTAPPPVPAPEQTTEIPALQPDPACLNLPEGSARDRCISGEVEIESGEAAGEGRRDDTIVVTGSRIRQPNLESAVPITSIGQEELTATGDVNIGDRLNDLPSLRSTFSQANSTRFIGTAGVNLLDLRGLGTSRTLVLVNGRRHVTYTPGSFLVDVNTIPTDLVERVDVVTGGNSAVYGSDAVAGVVNFILKRDFEGLRLRGQSGVSSRGDRAVKFLTFTGGQNFFDDRGNVAINLEYVDADPLFFKDRPDLTGAFDGRCQFNFAEPFAGEPSTGDGVPDNQFFCGVRNQTISDGGTVTSLTPSVIINGRRVFISCNDPRILTLVDPAVARERCLNPGNPTTGTNRFLNFGPTGTLCEEIPALTFRPFGSGNYIANPDSPCAPGSTLRNVGQLAPGLNRYTANLLASFEVSDALRPFVEAKFARVDALEEGQSTFFVGSFPGFFGAGRGIRCDNPFLTPQNIEALQTIGRCPGGATSSGLIPLARFNTDFGGRREDIRRDTYRVVGGVAGDFNVDWNYEVSVNYGRLETSLNGQNSLHIFNIDNEGNIVGEGPFLNAIDAVRLPSGQIVCRINADADPTNDDPACVPINVFGSGAPSQAALDYVNTDVSLDGSATELDILGFVNGDTSQLFELPGGPVRFSLGAEYRRERAYEEADPLSSAGATFFNAFPVFDPPTFSVKEVFGELQLPILRGVPGAEELTVSGAARYSDYNTSADKTFSWNANAVYAPFRDLKFRGNYSKAVRVPTLGDLFQPATQNFAFVNDPCDVLFINAGSPNRPANCAALGVPPGFVNDVARRQTIEIVSGGNPNLEEETGKSLTLGSVFTPRWVPGLSLTVDYYRIRVENLISFLNAQTILNQCVDLPSINNQFCQLIFPRNPDGSFATPVLLSSGVNFARQEADGIDFEAAYRRNTGEWRLNLHGVATYVLKRNNFTSPSDPEFANRQLSELGDPQWAANFSIGVGRGPIDLLYTMNYIGKQVIFNYEDYFPVQGRDPENADRTREVFYPDVLYHAARLNFIAPGFGTQQRKLNFYLGVDNLFDTKPPFGLLGTGAGDPFDTIGRYFYGGFTLDF